MWYYLFVGKHEKRIKELLRFPEQMRFEDVAAILEHYGFTRRSGKGSHNRFSKAGEQPFDIPSVNGKFVKRTYLQQIAKRLGLKEEL
jgi:predicted RNA binding protein YcfA (HicA-like mRNA interferase family)